MTLAPRSQVDATGNVFVSSAVRVAPPVGRRGAPAATPLVAAVTLGDGARAVLRGNVFAGFGGNPVQGLPDAEREPMRAANVVVSDVSTFR
jgi:hypothetical protein